VHLVLHPSSSFSKLLTCSMRSMHLTGTKRTLVPCPLHEQHNEKRYVDRLLSLPSCCDALAQYNASYTVLPVYALKISSTDHDVN